MMLIKKLLVIATLTASAASFAQQVTFDYPATGGTGCPQGSVGVALSPDGTQMSLLFDSFVTEAGPASGRTMDYKQCNVAIPVHVPSGFTLSIIGVDYRGFVGLPSRNSSATLITEYFLGNARGPSFNKTYKGAQNTDYFLENDLLLASQISSGCGADVNLRTRVTMRVQNTSNQDAIATVDSADFSSGVIYHLALRRCR